jgi:hypothetical protein
MKKPSVCVRIFPLAALLRSAAKWLRVKGPLGPLDKRFFSCDSNVAFQTCKKKCVRLNVIHPADLDCEYSERFILEYWIVVSFTRACMHATMVSPRAEHAR